MKVTLNLTLLGLAIFLPLLVKSQHVKIQGIPFIKNYTSEMYHASEQNWSATQSHSGLMYIANNFGTLEFDGNSWRTIPDGTRSVYTGTDGTIYAGGIGNFGYLVPEHNKLIFKSLLNKISNADTTFLDIWNIHMIGKSVIFRSNDILFIYENDKIQTIKPEKSFRLSFVVKDNFYIRDLEVGLKILKNNKLELIPGSEIFAHEIVTLMLPHENNKLLIGTRNKGLFLYDGTRFYEMATPSDDFLKKNAISCGIALDSGYYAIGTGLGGVLIIDKHGNPLQLINKEKGLQNNTVWNIFKDNAKNLWVTLNSGISYIEINSPFTYFGEKQGFDAKCYTALVSNNKLYIGGSPYIFSTDWEGFNNALTPPLFTKIEYTATHTWNIISNNNQLISAHYANIQIYNKGNIEQLPVPNQDVYAVFFIDSEKKILIAGGDNACSILKYDNKKWNVIKQFTNISARWFARDSENYIWAVTQKSVFYKFKLNDACDSLLLLKKYYVPPGLILATGTLIARVNNKMIAPTTNGFLWYNKKTDKFEPYDIFNHLISENSPVAINAADSLGNVYFTDNLGLAYLHHDENENYTLIRSPFLKLEKPQSIFPAFILNDSNVLLGQSNGFIHYNPLYKKKYNQPFTTLIRKVEILTTDSVVFSGINSDTLQENYFSPDFDSYRFIFSASFYENPEKNEYQYMLEGYDSKWSNWTTETKKEYTNLSSGKYVFKVKSRNVFKQPGSEVRYSFTISTPWYKTIWAFLVYALITSVTIYLFIKLNMRRLKLANMHLENLIKERTQEIRNKNSELETQKEEIQTQADELEYINAELGKINNELATLSIVASKTDNAVIIMDANGNIEWVNEGFTRFYGYTYDEILQLFGKNIAASSSNIHISELLTACIANKETQIFESKSITKNGKKIWFQSTLTPIFDHYGNIDKLVIIDSNIDKLKKAEAVILDQNENIKASLRYALTIQQAVLPTQQQLNMYFETFIVYKPKDIVSGDFYWYTETIENNCKTIFLAVVDCTGHGVPGAFMSLIGFRLLREIVVEQKVYSPNKILEHLDEAVRVLLRQKETDNQDGMDVGLCKVTFNPNRLFKVTYASSKIAIFFANNTGFHVVNGDKKLIGGYVSKNSLTFSNQEIELNSGDIFYISSDGVIDHCNTQRQRYGKKRLTELLKNIYTKPLPEQKQIIENDIANWQQSENQRDDITLLGVKLIAENN